MMSLGNEHKERLANMFLRGESVHHKAGGVVRQMLMFVTIRTKLTRRFAKAHSREP